jgi:O-antigen biosynthesis protein
MNNFHHEYIRYFEKIGRSIMKTSIIILTYNKFEYTKQCIESIRKYTQGTNYELIVVDNASTDETTDWLKQQMDIKTIFNDENVGFPRGCNQGIEIASGENILLLNNDVIVTKNWLENLLVSLYSSETIGAVGPVTNSAAYYSTIPVSYKDMEDMHQFAEEHNKSNPIKWEERLKLIGFCMLIKRIVVDKIGLLDERFTPGNFEDDDYSIRIRKAGYKLLLCNDTFIHHYGSTSWQDNESYNRLLTDNEVKFKEKWGTDSSSYFIHQELIDMIIHPNHNQINVLHFGCQAGATLLKIKKNYPNARLFGVENNEWECIEAKSIGDIYRDINELPKIKYDIILFTDHEFLLNSEVLKQIIPLLKKDGIFLGKFLNVAHYSIVHQILSGKQPLKNNTNLYSFVQLNELLSTGGLDLEIIGLSSLMSVDEKNFVGEIEKVFGGSTRSLMESHSIILKGKNNNNSLSDLLLKINEKDDIKNELEILNKFNLNEIINLINSLYKQPINLLHKIAINNFQISYHDYVLPYLQEAYNMDSTNNDTLYNLSFVLVAYGELEIASKYLKLIEKKDEVTNQLSEFIDKNLKSDDQIMESEVIQEYSDYTLDEIEHIEQNNVQFTGERIVINKVVKENFKDVMEEHLARYNFARQFVENKVVLDAACGSGYGTKILHSSGAKNVIGVDVSSESLLEAEKTYAAENIKYLYGDVNSLNFEDESFDVVVSFETIEHIRIGNKWISESARVLKDEGLFIVSTPNRTNTNPGAFFDEKPLNHFHEFEYNLTEFVGELLKEYDIIDLYGQTFIPDHQSYFSQVMRQLRKMDTNYTPSTLKSYPKYQLLPLSEMKDATPTYIVALCSKKKGNRQINKDINANQLHEVLNKENTLKQELIFLLRRIEFGVDFEDSIKELIEKLDKGYFEENEIYDVIAVSIYDKVKVLQAIAIACFENDMKDYVLPFLNVAYEIEKNNIDTLYNLAYVLTCYGERNIAKNFLDKIVDKDEKILQLLDIIQEEQK